MTRTAFAPGKIILSGEYAVVFGYPGIAMPAKKGIEATFEEDSSLPSLRIDWEGIPMNDEWKKYFGEIVRMCAERKKDAFEGSLRIRNDIPLGKGMGSSTALIIAVYRALLGGDCREIAEAIEEKTYPNRSGLDFAVIWGNRPVQFTKGKPPQPIVLAPDILSNAILIDTGAPNETTMELVEWVKSRRDEPGIKDALDLIGNCSDALCKGEHPLTVFPDHHRAQLALGVVPDSVHELILAIEAAEGAAKVIGAGGRTGGGGMVLAVHMDKERLVEAIPKQYHHGSL